MKQHQFDSNSPELVGNRRWVKEDAKILFDAYFYLLAHDATKFDKSYFASRLLDVLKEDVVSRRIHQDLLLEKIGVQKFQQWYLGDTANLSR